MHCQERDSLDNDLSSATAQRSALEKRANELESQNAALEKQLQVARHTSDLMEELESLRTEVWLRVSAVCLLHA